MQKWPGFSLLLSKRENTGKVKGLWPNIQQAEKEKALSDVNTFLLASYRQTAVTGNS